MATKLTISSVSERDVDLLLLEEFVVSSGFTSWFAERTAGIILDDNAVRSAQRSVTSSSGESDLKIDLDIGEALVHSLLIENKVAASFQPRQAERYQERGEAYRSQGECAAYTTVLVAPKQYLGVSPSKHGFDEVVSYEDIQEWFEDSEDSEQRISYKQTLLAAAINKSSIGYQKVEDDTVTDFWQAYWSKAQEIAPQLEMRKPPTKPSGAGHIYFSSSSLPQGVSLVQKLGHGYVDLQFGKMGTKLDELRDRLDEFLEPGMSIERATGSGAIRLHVPKLYAPLSFDAQADSVEEGIVAATRLLEWCMRNTAAITSMLEDL